MRTRKTVSEWLKFSLTGDFAVWLRSLGFVPYAPLRNARADPPGLLVIHLTTVKIGVSLFNFWPLE